MKSTRYSVLLSTITLVLVFALSALNNIATAEGCACPYVKTDQHGGQGGRDFSDNLTETIGITRLSIRHGDYIDSIQTTWLTADGRTITGNHHGGVGGTKSIIKLSDGEYINRIEGRSGDYIDQLTFYTNLSRKYGPYGGHGGSPFRLTNLCVGGFFGSSGDLLDAIGVFNSGKNKSTNVESQNFVLQKPIMDLTNAEFSFPQQASSYYPRDDKNRHIHLGTPTQYQGQVAKPGNVFITFIGIKVTGINLGNIPRCNNGYFDVSRKPLGTPQEFINVLDNLDLLVDGCR
jgi:hypothetical protein